MPAGSQMSGVPFDVKGGAGPLRVTGQIAEKPEEAASTGELGIEQVGGSGHGRNDAGCEIVRLPGGEGQVVAPVIVRAGEPLVVVLADEGTAPFIVVVRMYRIGKAPGKTQLPGGEGSARRRGGWEVVPGPAVDDEIDDSRGPWQPTGLPLFVEREHGAVEDWTGTAHS